MHNAQYGLHAVITTISLFIGLIYSHPDQYCYALQVKDNLVSKGWMGDDRVRQRELRKYSLHGLLNEQLCFLADK